MKRLLTSLALAASLTAFGALAQETRPAEAPATAPAAAAPAVPAPAPTKPEIVEAAKISAGDTAWMLTSGALVLFMTIPGLALFYGGMVRKKNVLGTLMQSFAITCLMTILWMVVGYSLAFMPGSPWIGGLDRVLLNGMVFMKDAGKLSVHHLATTIPESVFMMFQMTFAIITPALIAGAFAERMKFSAVALFIPLWVTLVYFPIDVSASALMKCRQEFAGMGSVSLVGLEASYLEGLQAAVSTRRPGQTFLVLFLGSTVGNFERPAADKFLREVRQFDLIAAGASGAPAVASATRSGTSRRRRPAALAASLAPTQSSGATL